MNNSVNVNFKVSGGDLQSYMDSMKQKADQLSSSMIENAKRESGVAKDQLKSYEQQIAALERKVRLQTSQSSKGAEFSRDQKITEVRERTRKAYDRLDQDLASGQVSPKDYKKFAKSLDRSEIAGTKGAEDEYKDELKRVKEEQRNSQTLIRTMRENVDTIKQTSQQQLGQMRKGDESLVDAVEEGGDPSARLANQLASQKHIDELSKEEKKKEEREQSTSQFGPFLKALAFERVGGMIAGMPTAKNELDYAKPMMAAMGMALGGGLGNVLDIAIGSKIAGFGVGQSSFGALGAQFGEKIGEFAGSAIERAYRSRDELTTSNYRIQALTGMDFGVNGVRADKSGGTGLSSITKDLAEYGSDFKETAALQLRLAQAQGTGRNLGGGVENALAAEAGLGVATESFMSLTELLRSSTKDNRDVLRLIGGVASAGKGNIFRDDRTFLNEFLTKNFTQLQKTLLQTQNAVASGTTFDILKRFDAVGGPFSARDSRSGGLINTIQGALTNPGSDNLKALSTIMLRRANPNMDFFELEKEKQKGLGSGTYLKSMIQAVQGMGGTESMQKLNFANMTGLGGNLAAADLLWAKRGEIMSGKISGQELLPGEGFGESSVRKSGKELTSVYSKSTAQIENAYIEDATKGITLMGSKMTELFSKMIDGVAKHIDEQLRGVLHQAKTPEPANKNATKTPLGYKLFPGY